MLLNIFQLILIMVTSEKKSELYPYISDKNEQDACKSHDHIVHLLKTFLESGRLVSGISTVWEDTDGCVQQYMCDLSIYLMTVIPSSYGIIMDRAINIPGHGKNAVDVLNAKEKTSFNEEMELMGKLSIK